MSGLPAVPTGARPITCSLRVAAPAKAVFDLLSDPYRHPEIDGSGSARRAVRGPHRLEAGSRFGMAMRCWWTPYTITNTVTDYEPDRLIAWTHHGRVVWRYELEPVPGGTQVSETWDPSASPGRFAYQVLKFPERTAPAMMATLERIKALVEA
ncbi:MAG TPA: SRPBCC family protein [Kineosporiaceae bacterium]|nr:SRPBCC family protein [Kineosporiaceae bacterium]